MRLLISAALADNDALTTLVGDRIYPIGSLGEGDIPADPLRPYIQWGWDSQTPYPAVREVGRTLRHMARFFYYDDRGDYTRIDEIHKQVRQTIEGLTGQVSPSGVRCTDAMFISLGGDLADTFRSLAVRQATFRIVAQ